MTKVFLDTNIVLDHALGRVFADEAEKIFILSELGEINCYISADALYTLAYVLEKAICEGSLFFLCFWRVTPHPNSYF